MADLKKVIKGLEVCIPLDEGENCPKECPYYQDVCVGYNQLMRDALALLKEQEVRELTMDEWREWKANPKRNPICKLWEHDTSPMWVLNPDTIHEPALLMGKLKLFTGKPTFEQCKAVKWYDRHEKCNDIGKWIFHSHNPSYSPFDGSPSEFYRCSGCGYITGNRTKHCPECGQECN